ncbi:AAA domain-containing protein [Gymnopilus junonius]|uniref:AAA domain-containing protein n=1 Tax=Gymnopilus junonius TaxID=109634 RepID=A0A9P5TN91_GYMJU|nr:AAA domain-containing protein [Gymnopilus junonius]
MTATILPQLMCRKVPHSDMTGAAEHHLVSRRLRPTMDMEEHEDIGRESNPMRWATTSMTLWFLPLKFILKSAHSSPRSMNNSHHGVRFMKLLALEEAEDEAAHKHRLTTWSLDRLRLEGYTLTDLSAYWLEENQFGRPVASFALGPGSNLPPHKFENGSQVMLSRLDPLREQPVIGSVVRHTESNMHICFPTMFRLNEGVWRLDLGRPNLMYERMSQAISYLKTNIEDVEALETESSWQYVLQGTHLRDVILRSFIPPSDSIAPPSEDTEPDEKSSGANFEHAGMFKDDQRIQSWARRYSRPNPVVVEGDPPLDGLNQSQIRAMAAMVSERVSLIQGPPGTGKTKTIIETIKLLKVHFEVPQPLLVCTYTNVAVDNLVEGFANVGVKPLRIGYNGNVRQSCLPHSLDYKLEQHPLHPSLTSLMKDEADVDSHIRNLTIETKELDKKIEESKRPRKATLERARNMKEALLKLCIRHKAMKRKVYAMSQQMLRDVIADADVICTTCITAACNALSVIDSPVVFVDEASMSTEPASLVPIMKGSRHLALIGDHKQLPPVIVSQKAKEEGFGISLFERLTEEGHVPSVMLDIQYRMHPDISHFPAMEFYDLALLDGTVDSGGNALPGLEPPSSMHLRHDSVKNRRPSVIFLDHTGNESFKGKSRINIHEGHIVASVVEDLLLNNPHLKAETLDHSPIRSSS